MVEPSRATASRGGRLIKPAILAQAAYADICVVQY